VANWVNQNRSGMAKAEATFTYDELQNRAANMDFNWAVGLAPEARLDPTSVKSLTDSMRARAERVYGTGVLGVGQGVASVALRNRRRNQPIESMLIQPDQLQGLGRGGPVKWEGLTEAEKTRVSPLRSSVVQDAIQERLDRMSALGVDYADFFDEGIFQRVLYY